MQIRHHVTRFNCLFLWFSVPSHTHYGTLDWATSSSGQLASLSSGDLVRSLLKSHYLRLLACWYARFLATFPQMRAFWTYCSFEKNEPKCKQTDAECDRGESGQVKSGVLNILFQFELLYPVVKQHRRLNEAFQCE